MTTVSYLEQLLDFTDKGTIYMLEAEKWHEMATNVSVSYDKEPVKSSGNKQRMENAVVNAVYYEQKARERMEKYFNERDKIIEQIVEMPGDPDCKTILYKQYVERKTLVNIADEIGYCDSHTRRKQRKALKTFEKAYGNTYLKTNEQ